jgi:acylaminoacyl-peptidase
LLNVVHMKNCGEDKAEPICVDEFFGGIKWDRDEKFLVFTTTRNPSTESYPWYEASKGDKVPQGEQYRWEESWGDSRDDLYYTSLWVADAFGSGSVQVRRVPDIPQELIPAHPIWTPSGQGIVFTGSKRYERRMGHIYCSNRSSALYYTRVDAKALLSSEAVSISLALLTENKKEDYAATFPTFSPDGSHLAYITSSSTFVHSGCSLVRVLNWNLSKDEKEGTAETILDTSNDAASIGLYCRAPMQNYWRDNHSLSLTTHILSR